MRFWFFDDCFEINRKGICFIFSQDSLVITLVRKVIQLHSKCWGILPLFKLAYHIYSVCLFKQRAKALWCPYCCFTPLPDDTVHWYLYITAALPCRSVTRKHTQQVLYLQVIKFVLQYMHGFGAVALCSFYTSLFKLDCDEGVYNSFLSLLLVTSQY